VKVKVEIKKHKKTEHKETIKHIVNTMPKDLFCMIRCACKRGLSILPSTIAGIEVSSD
jgi:hypothetical protein